jgi:hypothetical protein
VLRQINSGNVPWREIGETAKISASKLADHGLVTLKPRNQTAIKRSGLFGSKKPK